MYQIKLRICQNIYYFRNFMLPNDCFSFRITRTADYFLFCKILGWSNLIQSFASSFYTAILGNASKNEPLCSCYEHSTQAAASLAGWDGCWKRRFCLAGESVNMQLFLKDSLSSRLLLSLRCVFDNKLTPFISGNGFSR